MYKGLSLQERKARFQEKLRESACCGGEGGDMESGPVETGGDTMDLNSPLNRTLDMIRKRKRGKKNGS